MFRYNFHIPRWRRKDTDKRPDRRVRRTKSAIRTAFAQLIAHKELDDITVKDIADLADINRKTFYNYYADVYQVADDIEDEIVGQFDKTLQDTDIDHYFKKPYTVFEKLNAIMNIDPEFYGQLLLGRNGMNLVVKLSGLLQEKMLNALQGRTTLENGRLEVVCNFITSGMLGIYLSWFSGGRSTSAEQLAQDIGAVATNGLEKYMIKD